MEKSHEVFLKQGHNLIGIPAASPHQKLMQ